MEILKSINQSIKTVLESYPDVEFHRNSLGELSKITFTPIQINPLNVSLSEKKSKLISCLENPRLATLFSFKVWL